jgi:ABC-type amino acid transport substrate-binding protein
MHSLFRTFLLLILAMIPTLSQAQSVPLVQRDLYKGGVRYTESTLQFCVFPDSPLHDFDRAVAQAIADTLLLEAQFHEGPGGANMVQAFENELFIKLMDECDLAMGANFAWSPLPDWLTISTPYYDAPYLAISASENYASLFDLEKGKLVGSRAFTPADMAIAEFSTQLGSARTWVRVPHRTSSELFTALEAKKLAAAIFWAPELAEIVGVDGIKNLHVLTTSPLRLPPARVGISMLSKNKYIRTMIDEAISHLQSTGIIDDIAAQHGLPYAE